MKNVRHLAEVGSGLLARRAGAFGRAGRIFPLISALGTGIGPALAQNPASPAAAVIVSATAVTAPASSVVVTVGAPRRLPSDVRLG